MFTILPLKLTTRVPKHFRYPKEIRTIGDELRAERIIRGLTQHQVAHQMGVNPNFVYEYELNLKKNKTIFALHKIYLFLGFIPKTLQIDESKMRNRMYIHRIKNGNTLSDVGKYCGLEKSTIRRYEKGENCKCESLRKIERYLEAH